MIDWIIAGIPGLPLLAAFLTGLAVLSGRIEGEAGEGASGSIATIAAALAFVLSVTLIGLRLSGSFPEYVDLGTWLAGGDYRVAISFQSDGLALALSALFSLSCWMVMRFSINYMHRERGFHRFFLILSLFTGAMQILVLGGNAVLTFVGWELAGVCSYLLIAYAYDRPVAAANATRAFVTNRVGDAGFVLGIFLLFRWTGAIEWRDALEVASELDGLEAGAVAACFLLAAAAKSAQLPFSAWLARAMEGPTPSSALFYGAVMVHAGVYLVIRLEPMFERSPLLMALMAFMGLSTALYGYLCSLTQTDVKSGLIFSAMGQIGLMFLACGLGYWTIATWHLCAHAIVRGYQFLTAPSLMHQTLGLPSRPVPSFAASWRGLYTASLQRFWLESVVDRVLVRPFQRLAADFQSFDQHVVDQAVGLPAPAVRELSSLAAWEERRLGVDIAGSDDDRRVSGLVGLLTNGFAAAFHWFEERLVLQGVGRELIHAGRRLGSRLNRLESVLARPRYLVVLVLASLIIVI
jgi:formate hydrogenlyase subunit 3/multisubunit Na+/H+ antiporter MnhD subunit